MLAELRKSKRLSKKYSITLYDENSGKKLRTIHIGEHGADDYTTHKDVYRKQNYIARHSAILKKDGKRAIDDPLQPAFWALHLLWSEPSIDASQKKIAKQFNIQFI